MPITNKVHLPGWWPGYRRTQHKNWEKSLLLSGRFSARFVVARTPLSIGGPVESAGPPRVRKAQTGAFLHLPSLSSGGLITTMKLLGAAFSDPPLCFFFLTFFITVFFPPRAVPRDKSMSETPPSAPSPLSPRLWGCSSLFYVRSGLCSLGAGLAGLARLLDRQARLLVARSTVFFRCKTIPPIHSGR